MADLATLQGWKTEAETALHELQMGQKVYEVWRDGRRVIYTQANVGSLEAYIAKLERQIAALGGEASTDAANNRRAARPVFG